MPIMSIRGLDLYSHGTIWNDMVLPAGVNKADVVSNIIHNCAELGLVYTNGDYMQDMIGVWSRKNLTNWERVYQALNEEYNPLHNYDRHEEWTDTSEASVEGSNLNKQAGFNVSGDMADRDSSEQATSSEASSDHDGHVYGNIGVTTSAQMIAGELDVRVKYNMLDVICDSFKQEFCLLIY